MKVEKLFFHQAVKRLKENGGFVSNAQYPLFSFYLKNGSVMSVGDEKARSFVFGEYYILVDDNWVWESEENKEFIIGSDELTSIVEGLFTDPKDLEKLKVKENLDKVKEKLRVKEKGKL